MGLKKNSKIIWIKGQENYVLTLESHGKLILHSDFLSINSILLCKRNENVLRIGLNSSYLYMVIKNANTNQLKFFRISTETLSSFTPIRERILRNLRISINDLGEIDEIDTENNKLVLISNNLFTVWDLKLEKIVNSCRITDKVKVKYSRGKVLSFSQEITQLKVKIYDLLNDKTDEIAIFTNNFPYFSEIIEKKLILGIKPYDMICINYSVLENVNSFSILGKCIRYYRMEGQNDAFLLYGNGKGIFVSNPHLSIDCGDIGRVYNNVKEKLIVYIKSLNSIKVISPQGNITIFPVPYRKSLSVLGINLDSLKIYAASAKGKISVFE